MGPNGSGKTTLLKVINGILKPKVGTVFLSNRNIFEMGEKERAKILASVPQDTYVNFDFTVWDIVMMGRFPYLNRFQWEREEDEKVVEYCMKLTNVLHLSERSIREISGGERQRVIIARALAQEPKVLLLDEPTSNLDISYQIEIMDLLRRLSREKGIIIICAIHNLNLAARYCDRVVLLNKGRIVAMGPPEKVLTKDNIKRVYGIDVWISRHPITGTLYIVPLKPVRRSSQ